MSPHNKHLRHIAQSHGVFSTKDDKDKNRCSFPSPSLPCSLFTSLDPSFPFTLRPIPSISIRFPSFLSFPFYAFSRLFPSQSRLFIPINSSFPFLSLPFPLDHRPSHLFNFPLIWFPLLSLVFFFFLHSYTLSLPFPSPTHSRPFSRISSLYPSRLPLSIPLIPHPIPSYPRPWKWKESVRSWIASTRTRRLL